MVAPQDLRKLKVICMYECKFDETKENKHAKHQCITVKVKKRANFLGFKEKHQEQNL